MADYEIPFDNMDEEEFLYRVMNEQGPMYMGSTDELPDLYDDEAVNDYINNLNDWD